MNKSKIYISSIIAIIIMVFIGLFFINKDSKVNTLTKPQNTNEIKSSIEKQNNNEDNDKKYSSGYINAVWGTSSSCEELPSWQKESCYLSFFWKDEKTCSNLPDTIKNQCLDSIKIAISIESKKPSDCSIIEDKSLKFRCLENLLGNDITKLTMICSSMVGWDKNACFDRLNLKKAKLMKNIDNCSYISNPDIKQECLSMFNPKEETISIDQRNFDYAMSSWKVAYCISIIDMNIKNMCFSNLSNKR